MNCVQIVGRMTKDCEIRQAGETSFARFTVAVNRPFKNKEGNYDADFIQCSTFGRNAEFISQWFHKGDLIGITGSIRTGSYKNQGGQTVYTTEVNVDRAEFVGGKSANSGNSENKDAVDDDFMKIDDNLEQDELPFS